MKDNPKRGLGYLLQHIDARILQTLLIVVVLIPIVKPIGLPVKTNPEATGAFDTIEGLESGSTVMFVSSITPSGEAELDPQSVVILKHLSQRSAKVILVPLAPEATRYLERYAADILDAEGYQRGVDYCLVPFLAGQETVYAAIGSDIGSLYGAALEGMVSHATDLDLIVDIGGGDSHRWVLAHVQGPYGVPVIAGVTGVITAAAQPYFNSGQYVGMLSGLAGAAEYEVLARLPGNASSGMDAQSLGHALIIGFVALGNIAYYAERRARARRA